MEAKHYKNPKLAHFKALQMYLELVREIPEVVEVRLAENDELHTVISGPRDDDDICYRVIDAELEVMHAIKSQPFLFHLVNSQRLPQDGVEEHIRSFGELVWKR